MSKDKRERYRLENLPLVIDNLPAGKTVMKHSVATLRILGLIRVDILYQMFYLRLKYSILNVKY